MAWQLIYTSVPRGLVAGRSGFCTVARHPEIRDRLVTELERVSAYDRVATDVQGQRHSPVISSHRIMDVGGVRYHLLSRIQEAGLDYTGRSAHIAHHLICDANEITRAVSPARILRSFPWRTRWDEPPRHFTAAEQVDFSSVGTALVLPAIHWRQETGKAANAVLPVENIAPTGCAILGAAGEEERLLSLFEESLLLLDPNRESPSKLWQVRFTTFLQPSDNPADFDWRGGWAGTGEQRRGVVLDLTRPESLPQPQSPSLARIAETGILTVRPGVRAAPAARSIAAIQASTAEDTAQPLPRAHVEAGQERTRRHRGIVIGIVVSVVALLLLGLMLNARNNKEQQAKELSDQADTYVRAANALSTEEETITNELAGLLDRLKAIPRADGQFEDQATRTDHLMTDMRIFLTETKALRTQIEEARKLAEDGQLDEARALIEAIQNKIAEGNNKIAVLRQVANTISLGIADIIKTRNQHALEAGQHAHTNTVAPPVAPSELVTNTPVLKPAITRPAGLDRLCGDWTYLGITNLADGVRLRDLFTSRGFFRQSQRKVFPSGLETHLLPLNEPPHWDALPDVRTQGTALDLRKDKLYSKMTQWAALNPDDCIFSSTEGNAVVSFQLDQAAFVLILWDNPARPFLPLKLPQKDWLIESPAQFTVAGDLLQTLHLRSLATPQATRFRLASSNLAAFKHSLKSASNVRLGSSVVIMDDHGSASGLTLDFGAYRESLSNDLQTFENHRLADGKQFPPEYTMYLNFFKDAGSNLLTNSCPDGLKDFKDYLLTRKISGDPWADLMDYLTGLFKILEINEVRPYLKGCTVILSQIKNKEKADFVDRRIKIMDLSSGKVREMFEPAKTDYRKFDGIQELTQFDWVDCKGFVGPSACKEQDDHYKKIQNFQFVINDLWSKIRHQVEQERRSFAGNKALLENQAKQQKESEDNLKDALARLDAISRAPGVITLEMEVAPSVWWPVIEFSEK